MAKQKPAPVEVKEEPKPEEKPTHVAVADAARLENLTLKQQVLQLQLQSVLKDIEAFSAAIRAAYQTNPEDTFKLEADGRYLIVRKDG